ncbi:50S ribosomal protein L1 [Candidatus Aerophobetes bacterium]|uniref:Large ribosomal subunit protein uL1 n=1 Tax=Aerophobetes bacterium TaxID=2030807 RepID=A0A497E5G7_UNCAE|nr:50S ribosomal protein L1 [Candidatus Aerophobetes bacterium]RLE10116.1 MAG: 50S ribosomal protein L1 [Candidatus Aerophobetes bacterium]
MAKRSKRYLSLREKIDKKKEYDPLEAIKLVKQTSNCNFEESVEVAISLNIKPKERGERVRGTVVLPRGSGKKVRVVVFAEGEKAEEAKKRGADYVGGEELIKKIEKGWLDFDATVSTPQMMRMVARLGRILGPRRLMPSPKVGTVSEDPAQVVEELKKGKIEFRNDATGVIHTIIGKVSFKEEDLLENLKALLSSILREKPSTVKGAYIRGISLCSTMGPGVRINPQKALGIL